MDEIRNKMIELLEDDRCPLLYVLGENVGSLADYLISNGVTVLTPDEAKNVYTVQEIEKLQYEAYDLGAESVLHNHFGLSWHDAAEVRKEVARLKAAFGWNPVSERLPRCGERVLITEGTTVFEAFLSMSNKWVRGGIGWVENVTHWMPFPEPPGKDVE